MIKGEIKRVKQAEPDEALWWYNLNWLLLPARQCFCQQLNINRISNKTSAKNISCKTKWLTKTWIQEKKSIRNKLDSFYYKEGKKTKKQISATDWTGKAKNWVRQKTSAKTKVINRFYWQSKAAATVFNCKTKALTSTRTKTKTKKLKNQQIGLLQLNISTVSVFLSSSSAKQWIKYQQQNNH